MSEIKEDVKTLKGKRTVGDVTYIWAIVAYLTTEGKYFSVGLLNDNKLSSPDCDTLQQALDYGCNLMAREFSELELGV